MESASGRQLKGGTTADAVRGCSFRESAGAAVLLAICSLAIALIVPPTDELPHCDDWDYVETARHFVSTGRMVYSDWPTTTLLTHVLWGSGFAAIFGDSYLVFRSSMFVMSWLGACGIFLWCRCAGWRWGPAFWVAALYTFNPLTITYEYSFMTDATGLTAAIWLGLLLHQPTRGPMWGFGVGILGGVAYLARQTAIVPLMAYFALLGLRGLQLPKASRQAFAVGLAFAPFPLGYWLWIHFSQGVPYATLWQSRRGLPPFSELADRLSILLLGTALYLSPVMIGLWSRVRFQTFWKGVLAWLAVVVAVVACCQRLPAPYERQEVFDLGVGFSDSIVERQHLYGPAIAIAGREISVFRLVTSLLALVSLFAASQLFAADRLESHTDRELDNRDFMRRWLMPLSTVIMVGLLCIVPTMHGRYIWPVSVFALLCLTEKFAHRGTAVPWIGVVLVAAFGIFGVVGIQDNSVCQQTIWTALMDLEAQGVDPLEINGGLEYGGVRRFTPLYRGASHQGPYLEKLTSVERDRAITIYNPINIFAPARTYSVTYGPLEGNEVIRELPFRSWLRTGRISVLRRRGPVTRAD